MPSSEIFTHIRPVPGFEFYYNITNNGDVYSFHKNSTAEKPLAIQLDKDGYPCVNLWKDGRSTTFTLHRLLGEVYIKKVPGKDQLNHKDGDKQNWSLSNLEWVTPSENMRHAVKLGLCKPPIAPRAVIDTCNNVTYTSIREAAEANNISYSSLKKYLRGITPNNTCLRYA